ncbi:MAG: hypothetical protein FJ009_07015 [Chloroflexi bacterium]|nr:hypothetical protein [Chloroflexota bacterium]
MLTKLIALIAILMFVAGCATITPTRTLIPTLVPSVTPPRTDSNIETLTQELVRAAQAGDTRAVQQLLHQGANINGRDDQGRTPVLAATHGNRVETARALIQASADINLRDHRMDNVFLYAGAEGLLDILKLAIAAQADTRLTNRFGGTALIPAAERGHVEIVKELLTHTDVNVNHVNNLGWTALLEAIILGSGGARHTEVVRLLVAAGANVNLADASGVTPLTHARQRGFQHIVTILENARAR